MKITVKLFANFRIDRFKVAERECPEGTTPGQIVEEIGIGEAELGVVMVNGRHAELNQPLNEGDTLSLFPLVGGG